MNREHSSHDSRRYAISALCDNGVPLETVKTFAGHLDASTTASYFRRIPFFFVFTSHTDLQIGFAFHSSIVFPYFLRLTHQLKYPLGDHIKPSHGLFVPDAFSHCPMIVISPFREDGGSQQLNIVYVINDLLQGIRVPKLIRHGQ